MLSRPVSYVMLGMSVVLIIGLPFVSRTDFFSKGLLARLLLCWAEAYFFVVLILAIRGLKKD